jgi:hypothetical protein
MQGLPVLRSIFDVLFARAFSAKRMKNRSSKNFLKTNATADNFESDDPCIGRSGSGHGLRPVPLGRTVRAGPVCF